MATIDKRDGYRAEVVRAVEFFGIQNSWDDRHLNRAKRICYRTVWTECHWRNYANVRIEGSIAVLPNDGYPDHGGDHESVGLYQQQRKWWGTPEGSMDPYTATIRFLTEMVKVKDWFTTDESSVCQAIQRSQFDGKTINPKTGQPYPYAQNYKDEEQSTNDLAGDILYFTHQAGSK